MRYQLSASAKVYKAGVSRVTIDPAAPVEELPAGGGGGKKGRGSGFGSAGTRTAGQAAMAAEAARAFLADLPESTIVAFTDGACKGNPGRAGSGARVQLPDGRVGEASRSLGRATNNIAELTAVGLALELLDVAEVDPDVPVALFTDSKYTNGVLCLGWKAKANRELIMALREALGARPGVALHWIAGHVGIDGNERADALANRGVDGITRSVWSEQ
jgi:ribonuclease HI